MPIPHKQQIEVIAEDIPLLIQGRECGLITSADLRIEWDADMDDWFVDHVSIDDETGRKTAVSERLVGMDMMSSNPFYASVMAHTKSAEFCRYVDGEFERFECSEAEAA